MATTQGKRPISTGKRTGALLGQRTRRGAATSGQTGRKAPKESVFVPLLTVWIVVLLILLTLVFWAKGNPFRTSSVEIKGKQAAQVSVPSSQTQPPRAATPVTSNRPLEEEAPKTPRPKADSQEPSVVAAVPKPPVEPPVPPTVPEKPAVARVALVIDDFGYDLKIARKFINLPLPLTFSVLPHLPHTREVAALAAAHGHEVLVHMPMEPHGYPAANPGKGALLVAMTPQEMVAQIEKALKENPYARGLNNHMGSRFTENPEAMRVVLQYLKSRGFYYLDSYTSGRSVAVSVAREIGVTCGQRDIFLDHEPTEEFVRRQIAELIRRAKVQGEAVAIGHPHPATLKVLQEEAETFEKEGIEIVPLRKLWQEPSPHKGAPSGVS